MLSPVQFDSFDEAYVEVLRLVVQHHQFVNAPRGNVSWELIGASFQLTDPTAQLPFVAARRANPVYNIGEVLWYLAGRHDVGMIAHYAPMRRAGTAKGVPADESAYGPRIFRAGADGRPSTFTKVIELLRYEAESKRGVLPVFASADLDDLGAPSVPCLLGVELGTYTKLGAASPRQRAEFLALCFQKLDLFRASTHTAVINRALHPTLGQTMASDSQQAMATPGPRT